jgi:hypothetical protein
MRRASNQHGSLKLAQERKVLVVPMERSSNRRFGLSKEYRRRDSRGISNRIGSGVAVDAIRLTINRQNPQHHDRNYKFRASA